MGFWELSQAKFAPEIPPQSLRDSSPKGTPFGAAVKFPATAKAVPLRDDFPRSGGRCRVATKGGVWIAAQRQDGRGTPGGGHCQSHQTTFSPPFFSKAALTADFGQNSPGFGQSA